MAIDDVKLEDVTPYTPPAPPVIPTTPVTATYQPPATTTYTAPETPVYKPPEEYAPTGDATVSGRLTGLLERGSPYVEAAKAGGIRTAQSRGLLNSTMAASAGEKAAIESALPIAQQDASTSFTAGMAGYTGKLDAAKSTQAYEQQKGIIGTQAMESSKLQKQAADESAALRSLEADINAGISLQDATQKMYLASYQAAISAGLSKQEAEQKAAADSQNARNQYEIQAAALTAEAERLGRQLTAAEEAQVKDLASAERIASANIIAEEARLGRQLTASEQAQIREIASQEAIAQRNAEWEHLNLNTQLGSQERIATANILSAKELENVRQLGADARQQAILELDQSKLTSDEKKAAMDRITALGQNFDEQYAIVQRDPNVPPDSKTTIIQGLWDNYVNNMKMIGAISGVTITWPSRPGTAGFGGEGGTQAPPPVTPPPVTPPPVTPPPEGGTPVPPVPPVPPAPPPTPGASIPGQPSREEVLGWYESVLGQYRAPDEAGVQYWMNYGDTADENADPLAAFTAGALAEIDLQWKDWGDPVYA